MIRLGIIGTGAMGQDHAAAFSRFPDVELTACCDLDSVRARRFAAKFDIPNVFWNADEFFRDSQLDAVSIVTTDESHAPLALQAAESGLHILCEKPLATTVEDAVRMSQAAEEAGVIHLVNFSYRRSAALSAARELLDSGEIGRLLHFEGHYLQSWLVSGKWGDWKTDPKWLWRLSTAHGSGGALVDIGVHLLDFVTFAAGNVEWVECNLKTFHKHKDDRIGDYVLDANDSAVITLSLINGALGTLHISRWATGHLNSIGLSLHGDAGAVRIDLDKSYDTLDVCLGDNVEDATWEERALDPGPSVLEQFVRSVRSGRQVQPDFLRGAYVQRLLAACFESHRRQDRVYLSD